MPRRSKAEPWHEHYHAERLGLPEAIVGPVVADKLLEAARHVWPERNFKANWEVGITFAHVLTVTAEPTDSVAEIEAAAVSEPVGSRLSIPLDLECRGCPRCDMDPTDWQWSQAEHQRLRETMWSLLETLEQDLTEAEERGKDRLRKLNGRWRPVNPERERPTFCRRGAQALEIDGDAGFLRVFREGRPPTRFPLATRRHGKQVAIELSVGDTVQRMGARRTKSGLTLTFKAFGPFKGTLELKPYDG